MSPAGRPGQPARSRPRYLAPTDLLTAVSLAYSVREGLSGFKRAPFAAFASTSALVVALVLIGLFAFLAHRFHVVERYLRERVGEVELFLDPVTDAEARVLTARVAGYPGVASVDYISVEEAYQTFVAEFGEGAQLYEEGDFLPASIRVTVQPTMANPDSLRALAAEFETWRYVDDASFDEDLLVQVQENLRLVSIIGLTLGTLVVLAALFLVGNTIRLTVYARRLLIRTMKLVGATDAFVRRPFLIEGLVQGAVAGVVAAVLLWGLYLVTPDVLKLGVDGPSAWLVPAAVVAVGLLIGWLGSALAVRRFIRRVALN
jgi:cell division transport system permease protein